MAADADKPFRGVLGVTGSARLHSTLGHGHMKAIISLLSAIALIGCAHTKTACTCSPFRAKSLESFGSFDSSTTLEDITGRVGQPDIRCEVSGFQTLFYELTDGSFLVIHTAGPSKINNVKHADMVLYDRSSHR